MAMQFCPYCGKPRSGMDTPFCAYCGRPFGDVATTSVATNAPNTPNAPSPPVLSASPYQPAPPVNPFVAPISPIPPYGAAVAPSASPYPPATSVAPVGQKSTAVALLLEWLVPGVGAMYAREVGLGVGWLVGTFVGNLILTILVLIVYGQDATRASASYSPGSSSFIPTALSLVLITLLSIGWFVARLVVVSGIVGRYNQRIVGSAVTTPGSASKAGQIGFFDSGRAASSAMLALLASVVLLLLAAVIDGYGTTDNFDVINTITQILVDIATLVPFAFCVALFRLPRVAWWRALLDALAAMVLLQIVVLVVEVIILLVRSQSPVDVPSLVAYAEHTFIFYLLIPCLIVVGVGFGIALLFAQWHMLRRQRVARNGWLPIGLILGGGAFVYLLLYFVEPFIDDRLFRLDVSFQVAETILFALFLLVPAIISAGVVLTATFIMRARLQRMAPTQL